MELNLEKNPFTLKEGMEEKWLDYLSAASKDEKWYRNVKLAVTWARKLEKFEANIKGPFQWTEYFFRKAAEELEEDPSDSEIRWTAVSVLVKFWMPGEEVRRWHNAVCGWQGTEGIVNPEYARRPLKN